MEALTLEAVAMIENGTDTLFVLPALSVVLTARRCEPRLFRKRSTAWPFVTGFPSKVPDCEPMPEPASVAVQTMLNTVVLV